MNILRTRRVFDVKSKAFFIVFKVLSAAKNCVRPESAPLKYREIITVKAVTLYKKLLLFIKSLKNKKN